jgi:hypothetical protein
MDVGKRVPGLPGGSMGAKNRTENEKGKAGELV